MTAPTSDEVGAVVRADGILRAVAANDDWVLGVDVGTSRSAGALSNGSVTSLEVDGSRWISSMVLLDAQGNLVVGASAEHQAGLDPDRVERTPKRYLGGAAPLLLGGEPVDVERAISQLIDRFAQEGRRRHDGRNPSLTVLTHPVRWPGHRRDALRASAKRIGLDDVELVEEPVAAAVHYVGERVPVGARLGVYDLGGGTFDTAILQRTEDGFESIGEPGGDEDIGGEHLDHLVYDFLGEYVAEEDPELWEQIQYGEERKWTRAAAELLTQSRRAKEAVSTWPSTTAILPLVDRDVVFTRVQLESMIRPLIESTIDEMERTITGAGLTPDDLEAIYLVGGSSRIPLVGRLMTERFGDRIATRDEPKSVVSLGAAALGSSLHRRARREALTGQLPRREAAPPADQTATQPPPEPPPAPAPASATGPVELREVLRIGLNAPLRAMAADAGRVFTVDEQPALTCFDETGTRVWQVRLPGPVHGTPLVTGTVVAVACATGDVLAFDVRTGGVRTTARTGTAGTAPGQVLASPVADGSTGFLVPDEHGAIHAFAADGRVRWVLPFATPVRAPLTVHAGAVYASGVDGRVLRARVEDGVASWIFPCPAPVSASVVVAGGRAFVAGVHGIVYAVDATTGEPFWGRDLGAAIYGTPTMNAGLLIVACHNGLVAGLDPATGEVIWSLRTQGTNPTGVVSAGSRLYVDDGTHVVLVDPESATLVGWAAGVRGWPHPPVGLGPVGTGDVLLLPAGRGLRGVALTSAG